MDFKTRGKKIPKEVSINNILEITTEAEIYRHFLGFDYNIGIPFSSPFRKDSNPSFVIYYYKNSLLFKDFGRKDIKGNVFQFVTLISSIKFPNVLSYINNNMQLGLEGFNSNNNLKIIKYNDYKNLNLEEKKTNLYILKRNWGLIDKSYFENKISLKTLNFFNVIPTNKVYLNNNIIWENRKNNPIYSWKINDKIKSYRPLENNPKRKWINNCNKNDIQGLKELKLNSLQSKDLILTKSMKDIMVYYEIKFNAIAPQSEHVFLEYNLIDYLKTHYNIISNFDNDLAGITAAYHYWNNFNIPFFFFTDTKDSFEYVSKYNLKKLKNTMNEFIY